MKGLRRLIGNRAFYAMVMAVTIPVVVQNGITCFVGLLDNVMVGRMGTEQMSGVAIANQLIMIFELGVFGSISSAGIFAAQFFGYGDIPGVRNAFRIKLYVGLAVAVLGILVFLLFGDVLIARVLQGGGDVGDVEATARYAREYLNLMLLSFLPFMLTQVYSSTLKETAETVLPMKASITAVLVNLVLNWVLIFGKLGLPALGSNGAAIATIISRLLELAVVVVGTHRHADQFTFAQGLYSSLRVPRALLKDVLKKGAPLLANELLWSCGMAVLSQCYSLRGLSVVAAVNICSTITHLFSVITMALGTSVSIIVGQQLGAGDMEKARDTDYKLLAFAVAISAAVGLLLAAASPYIPLIYNTEDVVRDLATRLILVSAVTLPIMAFAHVCYFTMRSGGKTVITFLFDCAYTWVVTITLAWCLAHFTAMPIVPLFLLVRLSDLLKCAVGFVLVKKGVWLQNIVAGQHSTAEA